MPSFTLPSSTCSSVWNLYILILLKRIVHLDWFINGKEFLKIWQNQSIKNQEKYSQNTFEMFGYFLIMADITFSWFIYYWFSSLFSYSWVILSIGTFATIDIAKTCLSLKYIELPIGLNLIRSKHSDAVLFLIKHIASSEGQLALFRLPS